MKALQTLTVSFCLACICAEIVTLLTGPGWPRRCIKALAALYILVILLRLLSGTGFRQIRAEVPEQAPVSIPSAEDMILVQTETQLEKKLEAECKERFGRELLLQIVLTQNQRNICVSRAEIRIPPGESMASYMEEAEYLRQQLGAEVEIAAGEGQQQ